MIEIRWDLDQIMEVTLDRSLEWTQNVEGFSIEALDEAIGLVTRHGIKVMCLLTTRHTSWMLSAAIRRAGQMDGLTKPSQFPTLDPPDDPSFRGIRGPFSEGAFLSDSEVYVIGMQYPPTNESIAVLTLRRPVYVVSPVKE